MLKFLDNYWIYGLLFVAFLYLFLVEGLHVFGDYLGQLHLWTILSFGVLFFIGGALHFQTKYRKEELKQLAELNEAVYTTIERSEIGTYVFQDSRVIYANQRFCDIFGYPKDFVYTEKFQQTVFTDDVLELLRGNWEEQLNEQLSSSSYLTSFRNSEGETRVIEVYPEIVTLQGNKAIAGSIIDVTHREEMEQLLAKNEQNYRSLFDYNPNAVYSMTLDGTLTNINHVLEEILGAPKEEIENVNFRDFVLPQFMETTVEHFEKAKRGEPQNYYTAGVQRDGSHADLLITNIPIYDKGEVVGVYGIAQDITAQKAAERKLESIAYLDHLTGLPNRFHFHSHLEEAMKRADESGKSIAVLFIDFDHFKGINDTLGHRMGDELLIQLSKRMKAELRAGDFISRQGGDEFLLLFEDITKEEMHDLVGRLVATISTPILVKDHELKMTPSIGVAMYPLFGETPDHLIKNADMAMYAAKEKGRNNYQFYSEELDVRVTRKINIEAQLQKAIEKNELSLVYQPQLDLATLEVVGVEALLRWNPEDMNVTPSEFIPIAEQTGLILPIGEWVLKTACNQMKQWIDECGELNIAISVNVSSRQLVESDFLEVVEKALKEANLAPHLLEIEITESVLLDVDRTTQVIQALKNLGVRISIDDFGAGHSSLNVLRNVQIDTLKLDRSLVMDVHKGNRMEVLVTSIIELGKKLHTGVVVEGIETAQQADHFRAFNVIGQGYYFSRPVPAAEIRAKWLRCNKGRKF
ncbi:bifunctional diguanylate cyclase/phosphodiesterase [Paenisporosarcina cavernae]|uniref:Bifunctional diguanylate cyclase/phosphodiesterase n=1 Tax=Paenisporosarcina cavernae TaxID=2320858 RepID=A0A385YR71_9BACL|nr:bifunctional diguanylate cyclase/phosphodiesterase [Paenisporosarcina cavernae]AYC28900.1 bifunctional diguanylate cyclase/phosphodiesterase [Paenisporosarcina cavernae]